MARGYSWALAALAAVTACAEDIPGVAPPQDQLHYPVGLALVPGSAPASDALVVSNTNFDQRYNAGSVMTLPVDALIAALPAAGSADVAFVATLPAVTSRVRVLQFGGEIAVTRRPDDQPGYARLFVPMRGRSRVTMIEAQDGKLTCSSSGVDPVPALDCSAAYMVRTSGFDPYSVAVLPPVAGESGRGLVAVGHIQGPKLTAGGTRIGEISLIRPELFDARIDLEKSGKSPDDAPPPLYTAQQLAMGGITGLAFITGPGSARARIAAAGRVAAEATIPVPLATYDVVATGTTTTNYAGEHDLIGWTLSDGPLLRLESLAAVADMRGLAVSADETRAYVAVRFVGYGGRLTSGIAVASLENPELLTLRGLIEVGDEAGRPTLVERNGRRLIYSPDVRGDLIHVVDVTTDAPVLVGTISGRANRVSSSGSTVLAHTLDAPASIVYVDRGARRVLFVSNFANSTLAVVDVTDEDPSKHRVVARFGTARNPANPEEEAP